MILLKKFLDFKYRNLIIISLIVIITGLTWLIYQSQKPKTPAFEFKPVNVEADVVKQSVLTRRVKSVGTLKADNMAVIKSQINGVVSHVAAKDAGFVEKDQIIMRFEDIVQQAELKEAEANLIAQKAEFERVQMLNKKGVKATSELDKALGHMEVARARVQLAKARLDQTVIKAPFAGQISIIDLSVGATISVGQELLTIVDLHPMKVDFHVPELYSRQLEIGQKAELHVDGFQDEQFLAEIQAINPKADETVHSILVRAEVTNDRGLLHPGMFAHVNLAVGVEPDALVVPETAVDRSGGEEYVYRIVQGRALKTVVMTGAREDGKVEILDNLRAGDVVITAGHIKVRDNMPVKTVEAPTMGSETLPNQEAD